MSAQESSSDVKLSDFDEEVPVVQLCSLPLERLHSLDPNTTKDISTLLTVLVNEESQKAYAAVKRIRKLLSVASNPPIQEVIDAEGVDILHKMMKHEDENIRYEAIRAISNILSSDSRNTTNKVLKSGCITTLVDTMNGEESWEIKEQTVLVLGSIAGYSTVGRYQVLEAGGLTAILSNLNENSQGYMKQACWAVSNMVIGRPPPGLTYQIQAAPFVLAHLRLDNASETSRDLLWALSYITEHGVEHIELNEAICELLVTLACNSEMSVSIPALRTIGNVASSSMAYTSVFIDIGILNKLKELLNHPANSIRREICFVIRSMCAKRNGIMQQVILSGILPKVITLAPRGDFLLQKEAMRLLVSICDHCSLDIKPHVLDMGISTPLTEGLKSEDKQTRIMCTEGLRGMFKDIKEVMSAEAILLLVNVKDIMENCKELSKQGMSAAQDLMQEIAWLANDGDLDE